MSLADTEAASAGAVGRWGHLEVALMEGPDDSGRPLLEAQHHQQVVGVRDTQVSGAQATQNQSGQHNRR